MPIRRYSDIPQQPQEDPNKPSLGKILTGTGIRGIAGALASEGGPLGALIAGGGEGLAELAENVGNIPKAIGAIPDVVRNLSNPDTAEETVGGFFEGATKPIARIGVEAALGSVPLSKVIPGGRVAASTIRSGAFSGVGEAGRELARGEDLSPGSIARSTAIGALFGNVFGRFGGPKTETPPAGPSYEVETTAVPGGRVLSHTGKNVVPVGGPRVIPGEAPATPQPPQDPRAAYWAAKGLNPPSAPGRMASPQMQLPFDAAEEAVQEGGRVPYGAGGYPTGSAAKSAAKEQKVTDKLTEEQRRRDIIQGAIERGEMTPGRPRVSESISAPTPEGGRQTLSTSYAYPEKEDEGGLLTTIAGRRDLGDDVVERILGSEPVAETTPPIAEPAAEPPNPLQKLLSSAQEDTPRAPGTPSIEAPGAPQPLSEAELNTRRFGSIDPYAGGPQHLTAGGSLAPMEGLPENSPEFLQAMERLNAPEPPTPSNLTRLDPEFKGFPMEPVSGGAGVQVEGATQGLSPLAQLFKSRVDAAGQGYRDLKAALAAGEAVPEEGRQIAGQALQSEARAAGLPTGRAARPQPTVVENPPTAAPTAAGGVAQTQKAREAALAKRAAAREAAAKAEQQPMDELAMAEKLKAEGVPLPEILQRLKDLFGEESGSITPAAAARLGMTATGAGLGALLGGAGGHPYAGAAVGAVIGGGLSPAAIAGGLKQLGLHPQIADDAASTIQTPEGVKDFARRLYNGLPQFQRFNLLADAWGLPANALAGPYGSAAMAGLEAHLSGDPRGMEVLRRLNPQEFLSRWSQARTEAQRLIAEGELGRAETQITGAGPAQNIMQWPGVQMTAGDVAARQILVEAGFTEEEARRITMTAEPELAAAKKVANFSKGSTLLQILQPFARTPANIAEQGAMRTPGLGLVVQNLMRETPDPWKQQLVQQGLGLAAGGAGYVAGSELDPETARIARRYMTNIGGQYSLPVGLGFAAGQAAAAGKEPLSAQTAANLYNALPLPSTAPLANWAQAATTGKPARGLLPNNLIDLFTPETPIGNPLVRPGRFRR